MVKKFSFVSSNGINRINAVMWVPDGKITAVLQIAHGMAEHIERYEDFALYLAGKGILVVGNDHLGHGNTADTKEELGYFAKNKNPDNKMSSGYIVVRDLLHVTKIAKRYAKNVPYFLLGHSMGSFLARRYLVQYGKELDGIIIMGTGNMPGPLVHMSRFVVRLTTLIKGDRYRSNLIYQIGFGAYNKRIKNPKSSHAWISTDNNVVKKFEEDEKCGFIFTTNGFDMLLSTILYIEKQSNIRRIRKDIPVLLVSGLEDPVGNYGEDIKKLYCIYKKQKMKNVQMKLYKGMRHEILNEVEKEQVYEDIYSWIEKLKNTCTDIKYMI